MGTATERLHWVVHVALAAAGRSDERPPIERGLPTRALWDQALSLSGLDEDELVEQVAEHFSLDVASLDRAEAQATRFLPEKLARSSLVFPLRVGDRELVVATCDPMDLSVEEQLRFASGRQPVFEVASPSWLEKTIEAHYRPESAVEDLLSDIGAGFEAIELVDDAETAPTDEEDVSGEPVIKLANLVLREAIERKASDVHLAPGRAVGTVHLRIDGVLQLRMRIPMPVLHRVVSRIKILGGMDIADRLRPQDGRARIRVDDEYYDLRISTVPTRDAEKAVIRVLYADTAPGIDDLGLADHDRERLRGMLSHRDSIVLVTGPTGSGKTTTLYAALQDLNTGDVNIMTVEDPIEYELPGITQIQVENRRGVTFASALRAILRQDPDIVLLGEIRDEETAEIAVQAAQTGHLVLATLHTNEALGVVARLQDLGLTTASISDSVCGVVAQRLVRRVCPDCVETIDGPLTDDESSMAARYGVEPTVRPVGCPQCDGIGYRGRRPVVETAVPSPSLRQLILDGAGIDALRRQAVADGMNTVQGAALELAKAGVTSLDEVDRALGESSRDVGEAPTEVPADVAAVDTPPLAAAASSPPGRGAVNAEAGDGADVGDGAVRVLLADDDPIIRQIAGTLLAKNGFAVIEVEDGVAALERLNSDRPEHQVDLMVSDLDMPRLDGYDLLRLARASPRTAALPIIVLTGSDEPETEARLIDEGADDYIRKPIEPARFLARVKSVLRRSVA